MQGFALFYHPLENQCLVSYNRFVELIPWSCMGLMAFLNGQCLEPISGVSFIDSTSLEVCHPNRANNHKTFKGLVGWGKSSVGWYFGFKLHLLINHLGEPLAIALTPGNVDERKPVSQMSKEIFGKLFGDRGYVWHWFLKG